MVELIELNVVYCALLGRIFEGKVKRPCLGLTDPCWVN